MDTNIIGGQPAPVDQKEVFTKLLTKTITDAVAAAILPVENAQKLAETKMAEFELAQAKREKEGRKHDLPGSTTESHDGDTYSFGKVFQGLVSGDIERTAPMEFAMNQELWAQGTVSDSAGGFLVPTQVFEEQIIPLLRPRVVVLDLGITQLPVTGFGVVEIPREISGPVVDPVAENATNTNTDLEFGNHRLEPRMAQSYIKASRKFLQLGAGADGFIRRRMAQELALTWNKWALKGTGVDGEPIGVYNTAGVGTVDFDGTTSVSAGGNVLPAFYKKLLSMEDALADADALMGAGSIGWATSNRFVRACRQIESGNTTAGAAASNLEMGRNVVTAGKLPTILDYQYRQTTQLAQGTTTEAILGNWEDAVLATWNNLSIEASNVSGDALQKRQTHIVAYIDVDVAVTQPGSFCVATGLNTSQI